VLQDLLMYLLQLVQALKYENFNDIQCGLEPGGKRDSQGLAESSTLGDLDRLEGGQGGGLKVVTESGKTMALIHSLGP
jgi:phosphatidylinositol 3-kinase